MYKIVTEPLPKLQIFKFRDELLTTHNLPEAGTVEFSRRDIDIITAAIGAQVITEKEIRRRYPNLLFDTVLGGRRLFRMHDPKTGLLVNCVSSPYRGQHSTVNLDSLFASDPAEYQSFALYQTGRLVRGRESVQVGRRESAILALLLQARGDIVGHAKLHAAIYPAGVPAQDAVRVYISQLRKKFRDTFKVRPIYSVRNKGWYFDCRPSV